ncbi:glycoside hydrolase family 61 protein [Botryobasidium botryosum FD-172 SS1]|uniref:lytic cellulose monooxygenase (C4-dehydrogenating) n=1 Tax=Botryobasidium botryosum (strain FD-172 SS1) TaxID=930990 RepID=A0A067MU04_BOTB1|nr:glycoside hydrolase family 61 protein [Botryobasidium botryosum FD-172 SS1]
MFYSYSIALAVLSVLPSVLGHGYVSELTLSSTKYTGYLPFNDPYENPVPQRIIRKIPGDGPITDVNSADIQCNAKTGPAPIVAKVAAGSTVSLKWTTWPSDHLYIPLITYMARAPSDITKWSPGSAAVWFKVHHDGYNNGVWAVDKLIKNNGVYTFTIPASLKAGTYEQSYCHEIIALHSASSYPGAQSYPSCIQVEVTGSGTSTGPTSGLVSFPGAYAPSNPGITFNLWGRNYTIPGPAVWSG